MNLRKLIVIREPQMGESLDKGMEIFIGEDVSGSKPLAQFDADGVGYEVLNSSIVRVDVYNIVDRSTLVGYLKSVLSPYGEVEVR